MIYSQTPSGILVAEQGAADERSVAAALKAHDRELRLVPQGIVGDRLAYKVYRACGSDRPAEFICFWGNDHGEPYPLSHRLVDMVRELDRNSRGAHVDEDTLNRRAAAEREEHDQRVAEDLAADWQTREKVSALLPRGQSLRRARARTGYHGARGS